jgi:hypothetical protein
MAARILAGQYGTGQQTYNDTTGYYAPDGTGGITGPQVMPGFNSMVGSGGPGNSNSAPYTPPAPAAGSATATNPFLNIGLNAYTQTQQPYNPGYLGDVSNSLWNQATTNLNENVFPGMDSAAINAGGYGGDRSYLSKGVAADRMNQSVFNAMAPVYQQDYNAWQNRALQGGTAAAGAGTNIEQLDLSRLLGMGNLGIAQQNADTNTGQLAANSAGVPTYTNPLAAGVGGALGLYQMLNSILNPKT